MGGRVVASLVVALAATALVLLSTSVAAEGPSLGVIITSPSDGQLLNVTSVTVTWTGTGGGSGGISGYYWSLDHSELESVGVNTHYRFTGLSQGSHLIQIVARDFEGNEAVDEISIVIDSESPSLVIDEPAPIYWTTDEEINVQWSGFDSVSGIDRYELRLDWGTWEDLYIATSYPHLALGEGAHYIEVRAWDRANNSVTCNVSVIVDLTPPEVTVLDPADGGYYGGPDLQVVLSVDDSSPCLTNYRVDEEAWSDAIEGQTFAVPGLSDGKHSLTINVTDRAGNKRVIFLNVTLDSQLPELAITSPSAGEVSHTGLVHLAWTADGTGSPLDKVRWRCDQGAWTEVTGSSVDLTLGKGAHTLEVQVSDSAGNVHATSVPVVVDGDAPQMISHYPEGTDVASDEIIRVIFSEGIDKANSSITVPGVPGVATWSGSNIVMFMPASPLPHGQEVTVQVSAVDQAGNRAVFSWKFTVTPNATFYGRVVDSSSNPIVNATIVLDGGVTVVSDINGAFTVSAPVGSHGVTVSKDGFETLRRQIEVSTESVGTIEVLTLSASSGGIPWEIIGVIGVVVGVIAYLIYRRY